MVIKGRRRTCAKTTVATGQGAKSTLRGAAFLAVCGWLTVGSPGALPGGLLTSARADALHEKTIDLNVENADLRFVVSMLQRQVGANIVIQAGDKPFGRVSLSLSHAPLEKALRYIARSANAVLSRDDDGVYIISPAGTSSEPSLTSFDPSSSPSGGSSPDASAPRHPVEELNWKKLTLQHAQPIDILRVMHWDKDYVKIDPFEDQRAAASRTYQNTPGVYVMQPGSGYQTPPVPIGRGNNGPDAANQSVPEAGRAVDPSGIAQAQQFPGGGGGFGTGGFGGGGGGGFPGGGGFGTGARPGNGAVQTTPASFPEGVDRIYALESDNSLFVYATPDGYARVRDIIKNLDIAPRQVQIKVEFVTASVADVDAFGINFSIIPAPNILGSSSVPGLGGNNSIQFAAGNVVAQLLASLQRGRGKVIQAPIISTTNNVQGVIVINRQVPFLQQSSIIVPGGNGGNQVVNNTTQNFLPVNTSLAVTPRINFDDTITLNLSPQISDISGAPAQLGNAPPTTTQFLTTLRTVRNGETMVLGGLTRKAETRTQYRVPILGDIPIIGSLFRSRNTTINDDELLIFVTPTIIGDTSDSAGGSLQGTIAPGGTSAGNVTVTP